MICGFYDIKAVIFNRNGKRFLVIHAFFPPSSATFMDAHGRT